MKKNLRGFIYHKAVIILFILISSLNSDAQNNSSYDVNTIPVTGTNNAAFGVNALFSNTTGFKNVGVGSASLGANTTGTYNTSIGYASLPGTTTGSFNTGVGASSLYQNGSNNVAIGYSSMGLGWLGGDYNTACGSSTLNSFSSGNYLTVLGYNASASGINATAIGANASVGSNNTIQLGDGNVTTIYSGVGTAATLITGGLQVTGGSPGIGKILTSDAVGNATWQPAGGSSDWSLTGNAGTNPAINFIGTTDNKPFNIKVNSQKAGMVDQTSYDTYFGFTAGNSATTGGGNTGIGYRALQANTAGILSTAVGLDALYTNTKGVTNSAFGYASLYKNVEGSFNTAIGNLALYYNVYGEYNTALGYAADIGSDPLYNATAIGSGAIVNASDKVRIGDNNVTVVEIAATAIYTGSDGRFKNNINENDIKGLDFINRLRPVAYNFDTRKFTEFLTHNMSDSIRHIYLDKDFSHSTAIRQSGFIAQEVEEAAQQSGYDFNAIHKPESENDNYSLAYSQFVVPLVKAVQELSHQNDDLRKELNELKSLIKNNIAENKTGSIKISGDAAQLFQNAPNPFSQSTIIKYSIPANTKTAMLTISRLDGIKVAEYDLVNKGGQPIEISAGKLSAGTYIYSLSVNGEMIDAKKMILTR